MPLNCQFLSFPQPSPLDLYGWESQGLPSSPLPSVPFLRSGCQPSWTCSCSRSSSQGPRSTRITSISTSTSWLTLLVWLRPGRRYCQCWEPVGSQSGGLPSSGTMWAADLEPTQHQKYLYHCAQDSESPVPTGIVWHLLY